MSFEADHFDALIDKPFRTVVFRDPLDRMISHYKYWKESRGVTNHRVNIPFEPETTFTKFASSKCMQNFQTAAMGSLRIEDFDVVGVTQSLQLFINRFLESNLLDRKFMDNTLLNLNISPSRINHEQLEIDQSFLRKFKNENELDYVNYNLALKMNT